MRRVPTVLAKLSARTERAIGQHAVVWRERYGLSETEASLLVMATRLPQLDSQLLLARARKRSYETIKRQASDICRKTGCSSLTLAVVFLLREVLAEVV